MINILEVYLKNQPWIENSRLQSYALYVYDVRPVNKKNFSFIKYYIHLKHTCNIAFYL